MYLLTHLFKICKQRFTLWIHFPKPLCPTRWCVRFIAIDTALKSYELLVPYLSEVSNMSTVDDSAAKSRGLLAQFENGLTYLIHIGPTMMHNVFALVESLSRILQASNRTVPEHLKLCRLHSENTANESRRAFCNYLVESTIESFSVQSACHKASPTCGSTIKI